MAEDTGSSAVSIVAILVVGALILFFAWFFVLRGGGQSKDTIEIPKPQSQLESKSVVEYATIDFGEMVEVA
jgi:hypothetical protein